MVSGKLTVLDFPNCVTESLKVLNLLYFTFI